MPIGPYKDFNSCVQAQIKKGHDKESAKKICGEIEKRAKSKLEKVTAWIKSILRNK